MAQKPRPHSHPRPLSPHLQIYRPQITSVLSITHRFTGLALVGGALILTYWLCAAAYGPEAFHDAQAVMGSWFGRLVLLGLTFSLFYHLANGVRHLAWDAGWGFDLPVLRKTGYAVVGFAVIMTALTFAAGLLMGAGQ
ncbi:MAG: succinate dehydrogenase, cytochrome b556 subunit [Rhodospirillales bacterium]